MLASAGTLGTRVWDFLSQLATLTGEQERHSRQLDKLSDQIVALGKTVERIMGKLEGIENRFNEKDAIVKLQIENAIRNMELERLRSERKERGE